MEIKKYGYPGLRKKAEKITDIDDKIIKLAEDMTNTMRLGKGIGLAANQVGVLKKLCVIDASRGEKKRKFAYSCQSRDYIGRRADT